MLRGARRASNTCSTVPLHRPSDLGNAAFGCQCRGSQVLTVDIVAIREDEDRSRRK